MIRHVLVPMDDSPLARRALDFALDAHPDADVTVLHVIDHVEESYGAEMLVGAEELRHRTEERTERLFETVRERAEEHGGELRTVRRFGEPARAISEYATEAGVDLVVMGSHGRRGISRVLLGDVAERVVRRSPVPVTLVR